jgi:hypothetical protein
LRYSVVRKAVLVPVPVYHGFRVKLLIQILPKLRFGVVRLAVLARVPVYNGFSSE